MERFYITRVGEHISIKDGTTHEMLLVFVNMKEPRGVKKIVTELCNMNTNDYIKYAISHGVRYFANKNNFDIKDEDKKWYEGAWSATTKATLKDLSLEVDIIPSNEGITPALVNEVRKELEKEKVNNAVSKKKSLPKIVKKLNNNVNTDNKSNNDIRDDNKVNNETVEVVKKSLPRKVSPSNKEPNKSPLELLKEEYKNGNISTREFLKRQKELKRTS